MYFKSIFPNEMNSAKVIPLFKTGNKMLNNYRPVSITAFIFKNPGTSCL